MNNVDEKSLEPQKISPLGTFITLTGLSLAVTFSGCQYHYCAATIMDEDGNVLNLTGPEKVKDISDCKYGKPNPGETLNPEINGIADLKSKLYQIKKELSSGKTVTLKMLKQLIVDKPDFATLKELGGLLKTYGSKLTIDWNGDKMGPAKSGIMLTYSEWDEMDKLPFGANNTSGGAKGGELFVIPGNQEEDFKKGGQGEGSFTRGAPVVEINTHPDLHSAPAQILILGAMYPGEKPLVQFCTDLGLNAGDDMNAVEMLTVGQPLKDRFEFYETQVKQSWANDSVPVSSASVLYMMDRGGILAPAPLGGKKNARIQHTSQNFLDSVPNSQFVEIPQRNSDQLNWDRFAPERIDIVHEWNVGTISHQIYSMWQRDIKLVPTAKKGAKNEMQNVVGCNEQFLDYYEAPAGPAKAGVPFRLIADEDLILARYHTDHNTPAPEGPNPLILNDIYYSSDNRTNNSGPKTEASYMKIEGIDNNCETYSFSYPVSPNNIMRTLKIQTDKSEYIAGDGKIILSGGWLTKQCQPANGIRGPGGSVTLPDCKLYLDDPMIIYSYHAWIDAGGDPLKWAKGALNVYGNVDVILELPTGKEVYRECGQTTFDAPKRGGQKPNAQYVKYQNQKTTFAGFGKKLLENGK